MLRDLLAKSLSLFLLGMSVDYPSLNMSSMTMIVSFARSIRESEAPSAKNFWVVPRNTTVESLSKPTAASTLRIALGAAPQQHGCRYNLHALAT